ncbi:ATP-binding response regulator [Nonlabens ponticola]|uniref:histidine kinase n=1 Tax=Nonlabens ponticola TaxID=2496866 RepID=A0A3S9MW95_9FLAO|nr:hybrid sensor histidine kinase/response regulator [Nonlabens ponticola]AZQ43481.1 response regulator [Nonlabens ponticola]
MSDLYANIICDEKGIILASNQDYFELQVGEAITNVHPFFESLFIDSNNLQEATTFNGVHIDDKVYDITAHLYTSQRLNLKLADVTTIYDRIQSIAQRKNESLIFNEILQLKNDLLKERDTFKDQFLENFSSEIRNPLTLIHAFSSMMAKSPLSLEQEQLMTSIRSQVSGILSLVEGMQQASHSSGLSIKFNQAAFSLKELLDTALDGFENQLRLLGSRLNVSIDKNVPSYISGDPDKLLQSINHLLRFVIYQSHDHTIEVKVSELQRRANISSISITIDQIFAADNSTIITKSKEEIRLKASKNLGLNICRELLDLMNASLSIDVSDAGTISYALNFKAPVSKSGSVKTTVLNEIAAVNLKRKIKTLIVEDQAAAQMTAVKILTTTKNFDTYVLTDARKIIDMVETDDDLDLIIVANSINQTDAIELLKMMKSVRNMSNRTLKYLALSLNNDGKENKKYLRNGYHAVLGKPYTDDDLLQVIYNTVDLKLYR